MDVASVCWAVGTEISIIIRRISGIKGSKSQNTISYTKHVPPLPVYILTMIFNWYLDKNSLWLYCITHVWSTVKRLRVRVDKLHEPGAICYLHNQLHLSISTSVPPLDTQQCTAMIRRSTSKCQTAISKSSSCTLVKYIPKLKCSFGHSKMSQIWRNWTFALP
jgi:hypothetical protein